MQSPPFPRYRVYIHIYVYICTYTHRLSLSLTFSILLEGKYTDAVGVIKYRQLDTKIEVFWNEKFRTL